MEQTRSDKMKNKLFVNITGSLISNNNLENFNSVRKY